MASFESIDRIRQLTALLQPPFCNPAPGAPAGGSDEKPRERPVLPHELEPNGAAAWRMTQAQKMEAIARVTGGIAHNFNNLLTAVVGYADLLTIALAQRSQTHPHLDKILHSANQLGEQVRQLMAFSQQQILEPEVMSLNRIVAGAAKTLRGTIGEHVELVIDLDPGLGSVEADPKQLGHVVSSLVANAQEAMPDGGRLTLRTRNLEVSDFALRHLGIEPGSYAVLEVADTGVGIDEALYGRIFEPFFSTKEERNGVGLGLAVVYGIVKQSGGQIRVESSPGEGSEFRVYLPRTAPQQETAAVSAPADASRQETILVADDDAAIRILLQELLSSEGYHILVAGDGAEGLRLSERHEGEIDLLLTDVVMPRMDGVELAQKVLESRPGVKVFFISGYTHDRESLLELLRGQTEVGFLRKPFAAEVLLRQLREMLGPRSLGWEGELPAAVRSPAT